MDNSVKTHHRLLYSLCLLIFVPFLAYVSVGYFFGASAWAPDLWAPLRIAFALFMAYIVFVLVLHSATAFRDARRSGTGRLAGWAAWYLALFCVSGLGFLIMSLLMFEGPTVVRDNIAQALRSMATLQTTADRVLPVPEYDEALRNLRQLKISLRNEIMNPSQCGVGPSAKDVIRKIEAQGVPFPVLRDSDTRRNCLVPAQKQIVETFADLYDRQMDTAIAGLRTSARFAAMDFQARDKLRSDIRADFQRDTDRLRAMQTELAGIWTFLQRMDLYRKAVNELEAAATDYGAKYNSLRTLVGERSLQAVPQTLDVTSVERIASPVALFRNLFERSGDGWVWAYLLAALLLDLAVVYTWSAAIMVLSSKPARRVPADDGRIPESDVRYLWTLDRTLAARIRNA